MTRTEYFQRAQEAFDSGRISAEAFDTVFEMADIFAEDDEDERFPEYYAEQEYSDDSIEAYDGGKFDDMNFMRHYER